MARFAFSAGYIFYVRACYIPRMAACSRSGSASRTKSGDTWATTLRPFSGSSSPVFTKSSGPFSPFAQNLDPTPLEGHEAFYEQVFHNFYRTHFHVRIRSHAFCRQPLLVPECRTDTILDCRQRPPAYHLKRSGHSLRAQSDSSCCSIMFRDRSTRA